MDPILGNAAQQPAESVFSGNGLSQDYNSLNNYANSGTGLYGAPQNPGTVPGTGSVGGFSNTDPFGNSDPFGNTNTFGTGNGQGGNPV